MSQTRTPPRPSLPRPFALAAAASLALLAVISAQEPAPPQTAPQTTTPAPAVKLNVLVTDEKGRFADDVSREDFRVFEDGDEQKITHFAKDESPLSYGLVVDNSGSVKALFDPIKNTAKSFVKYNRPEDETFVVRFVGSDAIKLLSDFTSDKAALDKALDDMYLEGGKTALIDAVYVAAEKLIKRRGDAGGGGPRRHALILISDGEDRLSTYKLDDLLKLLRASDIQIFCIGFVGALEKERGYITSSMREKAIKFLTRLADETGGRAFFPLKFPELDDAFAQVMLHLRTQHTLGYTPPAGARVKTSRSIEVKIADAPGRGKRTAITRPRLVTADTSDSQTKKKN